MVQGMQRALTLTQLYKLSIELMFQSSIVQILVCVPSFNTDLRCGKQGHLSHETFLQPESFEHS